MKEHELLKVDYFDLVLITVIKSFIWPIQIVVVLRQWINVIMMIYYRVQVIQLEKEMAMFKSTINFFQTDYKELIELGVIENQSYEKMVKCYGKPFYVGETPKKHPECYELNNNEELTGLVFVEWIIKTRDGMVSLQGFEEDSDWNVRSNIKKINMEPILKRLDVKNMSVIKSEIV